MLGTSAAGVNDQQKKYKDISRNFSTYASQASVIGQTNDIDQADDRTGRVPTGRVSTTTLPTDPSPLDPREGSRKTDPPHRSLPIKGANQHSP